MPTRNRFPRASRYRRSYRRKRSTASRALVVRKPRASRLVMPPRSFGMPARFVTKLPYNWRGELSVSAGTGSQNTFRLNSVYDPDFTGIGTQPRYFDQLSALYSTYLVTGCKADATWHSVNTTDTTLQVTMIGYNGGQISAIDTTSSQWVNEYCRRKFLKSKFIHEDQTTRMSQYYPIAATASVSNSRVRSDENWRAPVTANPPSTAKLTVGVADPKQSVNSKVELSLVLTYYVTFYNPVPVGQS